MGLPDGVHHLALATKDMKAQLAFFTQVVGMELEALYWMHGVENTVHAFLRLGDTCSLSFVQAPDMAGIEPVIGVSHPGFSAGSVAPGAMQHLALSVPSEVELLALRDRLRSHGYWVAGPVNHNMCKSMYVQAPEGLILEFATAEGAIDVAQWIDPAVVAFCGISAAELESFVSPPPFTSQGGKVPQPAPTTRPNFVFTGEWAPRGEAFFQLTDAQIAAALDSPTPPVPRNPPAP
ncbi:MULTISPECIES: VOC family protein [Corallococcus]|uniref:VOC family protein n=1 Tax=Corallococcus TaxID=83461 RepID=UPI00117D2B5C|nr:MULTISPECIES: VOC family protein [Corallococcus]NBD08123.1 VOC family protein [Corallococcus silvisoli]TSC34097.1 VOC family protein [Corallococcus sp. Z5C101001]